MTNKEYENNSEELEKEELVEETEEKNEKAQTEETAGETAGTEKTDDSAEETDPLAEANDKYLRLAAEFDNFKRRTQKEKGQIYVSAACDVIEAVLPFIDNINRATAVDVESEDATKLLEGIKLVERQFMDTLKNLGVEEIKAVGEKFDPNLHNAVMHVDDETVDGEEIIVEEFVKGYIYKDKVIRHSTVKVAN